MRTLHGAGDTGSNFIHAAGLTNTADSEGFVLVGPTPAGARGAHLRRNPLEPADPATEPPRFDRSSDGARAF